MYIVDGIAIAGDAEKPITLLCVRPLDDYLLQVRFSDGRCGIFDASPLLDAPAFLPLKEKATFDRVYVDFGVPTWMNGDVDIAPEYVYAHTAFIEEEKGA